MDEIYIDQLLICNGKCNETTAASVQRSSGQMYLNYTTLTVGPNICLCPNHALLVKKLYMKRNLLESVPDEYMNMFRQLVELYLPSNKLHYLPANIGQLQKLIRLDVDDNKLTSLPASITDLTELKILQLRNNQLTYLPRDLGNLKSLVDLDASCNKLTSLPDSIGKLQNLEELRFSYNKISTVPRQICKLQKLSKISLSNNQLVELPIDCGTPIWHVGGNKTLHFVSTKLNNVIGLNGCGRTPLIDMQACIFSLKWCSFNTHEGQISCYIPHYAQTVRTARLRSLKEIASNVVYDNLCINPTDLPILLYDRLTSPLGECVKCKRNMFWEVVVKLKRSVSYYLMATDEIIGRVISLAYFCSKQCAIKDTSDIITNEVDVLE